MKKKGLILLAMAAVIGLVLSCSPKPAPGHLPRGKASANLEAAWQKYVGVVEESGLQLHSVMVVKDGKVVEEKFFQGSPDSAHVLNSCSKTFTSMAVGLAISEGRFTLDTPVVSFFPDLLPEHVSDTLQRMTVENLLTMTCGHATEPNFDRSRGTWVKDFLATPVKYEPGIWFCYNSIGTYMLSAIIQRTTGQKLVDYLEDRLWKPLDIDKPYWEESPEGINIGGWGLYLKTEDLAKLGLTLLQGGVYNGKQVIPADWVRKATTHETYSVPSWMTPATIKQAGMTRENSDWVCGYGYQMWMCRHNAFRADGAGGQYIIVIPEKNAVVACTAGLQDMQMELNQIWDNLLEAL